MRTHPRGLKGKELSSKVRGLGGTRLSKLRHECNFETVGLQNRLSHAPDSTVLPVDRFLACRKEFPAAFALRGFYSKSRRDGKPQPTVEAVGKLPPIAKPWRGEARSQGCAAPLGLALLSPTTSVVGYGISSPGTGQDCLAEPR